jgi:hypothetical protein
MASSVFCVGGITWAFESHKTPPAINNSKRPTKTAIREFNGADWDFKVGS